MIGILSEEEIEEVLKNNTLGHIGCNDGFNTYVYPINYLYDGKFIICHSPFGSKIQVMRQNKRVCFLVEEVTDSSHWRSVLLLGDYQELGDERNRAYYMKEFNDRNMHLKISESLLWQDSTKNETEQHGLKDVRPAIYRIIIDEKNGRYEDAVA
jgi:uncharacterized protein